MADTRAIAEAIFREEFGRILASLIRRCRSFELAEESLQEAFASALLAWPVRGIPENPAAWITAAANNKLLDAQRRESTRRKKSAGLLYETAVITEPQPLPEDDEMSFPDDRLRLMFTCCHPALNPDAQIALTLRTLGGLSTAEIAKAFLVPEPTLAQRLVRAKRKIQDAQIPYEVPPKHRLAERLASVQSVLYLIFNEGYAATADSGLIRNDLCQEAIRLSRIITALMPDQPENLGLLALMLLQDSRRRARVNAQGDLITLEEQDRTLWDRPEIQEGTELMERALRMRSVGPYQVQAAIAALHATPADPQSTDWRQIAALYGELSRMIPSSIIRLNRAVAIAMGHSLEEGLALIDELAAEGDLGRYYLLHASRADLLRRLQRFKEAELAYREALQLVSNPVERRYLERRLGSVRTA